MSLERIGTDPKKAAEERALLPGLKEALLWKPNTPQLENAMTYAWEQGLRSFIRAIEANTLPSSIERITDPQCSHEECMTDAGHSTPCIYAPTVRKENADLPELIRFWRTFKPISNERAAADIIERLLRDLEVARGLERMAYDQRDAAFAASAIAPIIERVEKMKLSCESGELYSMADECTRLLAMLRAADRTGRTD